MARRSFKIALLSLLLLGVLMRSDGQAENLISNTASSDVVHPWNLGVLTAGATYSTTIEIKNPSTETHNTLEVSVRNAPWLRIVGSPTADIPPGGSSRIEASLDLHGLRPGSYGGWVLVKCVTCPSTPRCPAPVVKLQMRLFVSDPPSFSLARNQSGFVSSYEFGPANVVTTLENFEDNSVVRIDSPSFGNLVELSLPRGSTFPQNMSEMVIGDGFRRADPAEQLSLLINMARSADLIAEELDGVESEEILLVISALPDLLAVPFEKEPIAQGNEEPVYIPVIGLNDGVCHGACGPKCDWCFCRRGLCVCDVRLACYLHDSCCGSWANFFDCGPCIFAQPFGLP